MWNYSRVSSIAASDKYALTGFTVSDDQPRVYYINSPSTGAYDVCELSYQNGKWATNNLTQGKSTPAATSRLTGFTVSGGEPRVYFIGSPSTGVYALYELAYVSGKWKGPVNLTQGNVMPLATSALTGFASSDGEPRIYFIGSPAQDVYDVYEVAYQNGNWVVSDITRKAGANSAASDSALVGFTVKNGEPRIYYIGPVNNDPKATDYAVYELFYQNGNWDYSDISAKAKGDHPATDAHALAGFSAENDEPRIYFVSSKYDVYELAYRHDEWHPTDVTDTAGGNVAVKDTCLLGFTAADHQPRIYHFVSRQSNNDVYELAYQNREWYPSDITEKAGASPAVSGSALAGFTASDDQPRVYFIGQSDNQVYELRWE